MNTSTLRKRKNKKKISKFSEIMRDLMAWAIGKNYEK